MQVVKLLASYWLGFRLRVSVSVYGILYGIWYTVYGSGFRVWGLGFRV